MKILNTNRKVFHNYFVEDKFEAGIILTGTEVKSCRSGHIDLTDAYVSIENGQAMLYNVFIAHYANSGYSSHVEKCERKLLLHKKEILKLYQAVNIKGYTIIPISFYLKNGLIKVEIALCKGKHNYDKRESLKEKNLIKEIKKFI